MSDLALVTGGAGFIGGHLAERLLREGWSVRVLDDFSSGREENLAEVRHHVELLRGDLRDGALLARALAGARVVFHQAAIPSVPHSVADPLGSDAVNAHGTLGVLEGARRAGVERVVFASSCAVYGDDDTLPKHEALPACPLSPYALQKRTGESYCRLYAQLYGLTTVALRYFNVYGPRQNPDGDYAAAIPRFLRAGLKGEPISLHGDGEQTRDFVYVGDVVNANLLAAQAPGAAGRVVNVASGTEISVKHLAERILALTGSSAPLRHVGARAGEVRRSVADLGAAQQLLGYKPSVDLPTGLRRTLEHLRAKGGFAA